MPPTSSVQLFGKILEALTVYTGAITLEAMGVGAERHRHEADEVAGSSASLSF